MSVSQHYLRSCAFFQNLIGLESALQRFIPGTQPHPFTLPEGLVPDRVVTPLGFPTFKAFTPPARQKDHLHLFVPLVRLGSKNLTTSGSILFRDSRTREAQHFPFARALAFRAFTTDQQPFLFNVSRLADYFFIFKRPAFLQKPSHLS